MLASFAGTIGEERRNWMCRDAKGGFGVTAAENAGGNSYKTATSHRGNRVVRPPKR